MEAKREQIWKNPMDYGLEDEVENKLLRIQLHLDLDENQANKSLKSDEAYHYRSKSIHLV